MLLFALLGTEVVRDSATAALADDLLAEYRASGLAFSGMVNANDSVMIPRPPRPAPAISPELFIRLIGPVVDEVAAMDKYGLAGERIDFGDGLPSNAATFVAVALLMWVLDAGSEAPDLPEAINALSDQRPPS